MHNEYVFHSLLSTFSLLMVNLFLLVSEGWSITRNGSYQKWDTRFWEQYLTLWWQHDGRQVGFVVPVGQGAAFELWLHLFSFKRIAIYGVCVPTYTLYCFYFINLLEWVLCMYVEERDMHYLSIKTSNWTGLSYFKKCYF